MRSCRHELSRLAGRLRRSFAQPTESPISDLDKRHQLRHCLCPSRDPFTGLERIIDVVHKAKHGIQACLVVGERAAAKHHVRLRKHLTYAQAIGPLLIADQLVAARPDKARAWRCRQDQSGFPASLNSSRNQSNELMQIALSQRILSYRALPFEAVCRATQILKRRGHDPLRSPTVLAAPAHA